MARIPSDRRVTFRTHTVKRGQTLAAIARQYGATARDVAEANGLASAKRLARGTELIIPVPPRAEAESSGVALASNVTSGSQGSHARPAGNNRVRIAYRIKAGDTLHRIATRYKTTVRDLLAWNKGVRASRLAAGDVLTVYTRRAD